jgi:hypothetical protein
MNAVVVLSRQQKIPVVDVPDHIALVVHDLAIGRRGNEAALGFFKVALIGKWEDLPLMLLRFDAVLRRHLAF